MKTDMKIFHALSQAAKFFIFPFSEVCLRMETVGISESALSSITKEYPCLLEDPKTSEAYRESKFTNSPLCICVMNRLGTPGNAVNET